MKIFISWSRPRSKSIAVALKNWIPCVLQAFEPFMSEQDIVPGTMWLSEISNRLRNSHMGIVCLTPESVWRPWLNFEAGALTRELEGKTNLVIPYLLGFEEERFEGPLSHFQALRADKSGTFELVKTLNAELIRAVQAPGEQAADAEVAADRLGQRVPARIYDTAGRTAARPGRAFSGALSERVLTETFNKWWPDLEGLIRDIPKPDPSELSQLGTVHGEKWPFATFYYGRRKTPNHGEIFQDFATVTEVEKGNVNAVQYMWADTTAGNEIIAKVRKSRLWVKVTTASSSSYPSNVAIRAKDETPIVNEPHKKYLIFGVRLTEDLPIDDASVGIGVRVVNGFLQHWVYRSGEVDFCEPIESASWKLMNIDLSNSDSWREFESDGNPAGPRPASFDCICSVVIEIGRRGPNRPDPKGTSAVEIGPLVLLDDENEYWKYLPSRGGVPVAIDGSCA